MGEKNSAAKYVLITISIVFVGVMLVLPLIAIIVNSLQRGWEFYIKSLTSRYVLSALKVTAVATISALIINTFFGVTAAWLLTKFSFRGKHILATLIDIPFSISPVIAGLAFIMTFGRMGWAAPYIAALNKFFVLDIKIVFAIPGVILATVFVTFPFISREIVPILNAQGKDEEEAAALMGADGFTIFRKITLPHIKWGLLYGIILCTARALGEFGAVNALSKARGGTFTLPLEIDALYLSGSSESITAAFAVSSLLVMISIFILIIKNIVEHKSTKKGI
ncbi:sulfate ABC transporter permease subunit [Leptotrichia shahii]|uniref:sulfate ABC transporter permease n=1 Tax=Leptotrichia shahii TaxID=157691 RepID=UPI0028D529D9|nr:sulfate ABC transporter permease subunit [Leptotrichia shahii]